MKPGRAKSIVYWTCTILVSLAMFSGGIAELIRQPDTLAGMHRLGYPTYFVMILGVWKILGTVALLAPALPRLKEWAYAGIFFDLSGAVISHAVCAEYMHIPAPAIIAVISTVSWATRPVVRRLA